MALFTCSHLESDRGKGLASLVQEVSTKVVVSGLAVVPYRSGSGIEVLLVMPAREKRWRLPLAPLSKKTPQYACAALQAQLQAGVRGRIHKHPIRLAAEDGRLLVFPFEVDPTKSAAARAEGQPARGWFPLHEALELVTEEMRPALGAFARRIGRATAARNSGAAVAGTAASL
jgi:hypothetical protein